MLIIIIIDDMDTMDDTQWIFHDMVRVSSLVSSMRITDEIAS